MYSASEIIFSTLKECLVSLYGNLDEKLIQIQPTRKEFEGNFTLVVFPLLKLSKQSPEETARQIGEKLIEQKSIVEKYNVIKGFLNITLTSDFWRQQLLKISETPRFGFAQPESSGKHIMIEFSSPNTNKPLHLGHIRNNLLGFGISRILAAAGHKVTKVNLVNDRGIHICKSMLAWEKFGNGETPETSGIKGDKLVGNYYVRFDLEYKKQVKELIKYGMSEEEAKEKAPILEEAREMLRRWENKDPHIMQLWETMNRWVYEGFDTTYQRLGIEFDKIYYESQTYLLGREIVMEGLSKGILEKDPDGSVWIDLTADNLDRKLLLRKDGTSVYMTQDLGTAVQRFTEFNIDEHIYVVGNEQNYHFQALKLILKRLGYSWADNIYHLSYGMVELPSGKMKSREGTVVDADDLLDQMEETAYTMSQESGKLEGLDSKTMDEIYRTIALGALKYFILRVDPKKNMLFNPEESIDFNGNTGPFIQYAHARIQSILRKVQTLDAEPRLSGYVFNEKEIRLIQLIESFPLMLNDAATQHSPAIIANYLYELAKEFNQYYHEYQILKESDTECRNSRLLLIKTIAQTIKNAAWLLGIEVPDRM